MVAHHDHLRIRDKCQAEVVLAHKAGKMVVRRQVCPVLVWDRILITAKLRPCLLLRLLLKCSPRCNLKCKLCGRTTNTLLRTSPTLCSINHGTTLCRCLPNTRHHTHLIRAHKCLIRECPCLLEIHLPLFKVLQRLRYLTPLLLLSTYPILLPSHTPQIVLV